MLEVYTPHIFFTDSSWIFLKQNKTNTDIRYMRVNIIWRLGDLKNPWYGSDSVHYKNLQTARFLFLVKPRLFVLEICHTRSLVGFWNRECDQRVYKFYGVAQTINQNVKISITYNKLDDPADFYFRFPRGKLVMRLAAVAIQRADGRGYHGETKSLCNQSVCSPGIQ